MGGSGSEEEMEGQTKSMGYESQCLLVPGESQRQAGSWDMNQPAPIGDASVMSSSLVCYTRSLTIPTSVPCLMPPVVYHSSARPGHPLCRSMEWVPCCQYCGGPLAVLSSLLQGDPGSLRHSPALS